MKTESAVQNIKITNIFGNEVIEISAPEIARLNSQGGIRLDVSGVTPGIYFLVVDGRKVEKFVVER